MQGRCGVGARKRKRITPARADQNSPDMHVLSTGDALTEREWVVAGGVIRHGD
jgi:hypothetical protein